MNKHLDGILTKENREAGFSIREDGDHFIQIIRDNKVVATFTQATTAQHLNEAADELRWGVDSNYENFKQQTDGI
jgi:hypothetical protein